jgi:hypothetical protein
MAGNHRLTFLHEASALASALELPEQRTTIDYGNGVYRNPTWGLAAMKFLRTLMRLKNGLGGPAFGTAAGHGGGNCPHS